MGKWLGAVVFLLAGAAGAQEGEGVAGVEAPDEAAVSVVQERLYSLQHELVLGVGVLPQDAFYKGVGLQVAYVYHFSDAFAWQVGRGLITYNVASGLQKELEQRFGATAADFAQLEWMVGSDLILSPVYGKAALFNQSLVWFSAHVLAGASVVKLNRGFAPSGNLGLGGRMFLSDSVSLRFDAADHLTWSGGLLHLVDLQLSVALNFGGGPRGAP